MNFYDRAFSEHGCTARGVHWQSHETQFRRFEVLARLIDGPCTVNDFACGYGAFFDFVQNALPVARYYGVDVNAGMISAARSRVADPRASFSCGTAVRTMADYTVASGAFGVPGANPRQAWELWIRRGLRNMWNHSRRGIAFNILDSGATEQPSEFYYADAEMYQRWCIDALSPHVEVVMPAGANDWTMFVRREP